MTAGVFAPLASSRFPDSTLAIRTDAAVVSRGELAALVAALRARLAAAEIRRGDRVLLVLPNSIEYVTALLATTSIGAIAVPASPASGERRIARVVATVAPALAITSHEGRDLHGLRALHLCLDSKPWRLAFDPDPGSAEPASGPAPDDPALLLLSSGSTGDPKCIALRHTGLAWTAAALARAFDIGPDHVELIVSPLNHSGAWQRAAATLAAGGRIVIHEGPLSIPGLLETCECLGVRGFYSPPPLVRYLLETDPARVRRSLAACRSIEVGSAPLGAGELGALLELLPDARIFVHYGLTECSRATVLDARARVDKLHTVGRPLPGAEVRVCDANGSPVPTGTAGEIRARGPQLAAGYWGDDAATGERFAEGFVRTGDVGSLDDEGYLTFLGRDDDRITSAGYSFFPLEVEEELGPIPGVLAYQIAGVPDPKGVLGELPWAFVVPSRPAIFRAEALLRAARSRLPPYMVPRRVVVVPELPTTATGKPDRRETLRRHGPTVGPASEREREEG